MKKKYVWVIVLVAAVALGFFAASPYLNTLALAETPVPKDGKLETIIDRGYLKVAIRDGHEPGLIEHIETPDGKRYEGFEPELGRAIAAAIFGPAPEDDPDKYIKFFEAGLGTRFSYLYEPKKDPEADITIRTVTYTSQRDMTRDGQGFEFAPIYLYDGSNVLENTEGVSGTFNVIGAVGSSNLADLIRLRDEGIKGFEWPSNWKVVKAYAEGETGASVVAKAAFLAGTYTVPPDSGDPDASKTFTINGLVSDGVLLASLKVDQILKGNTDAENWELSFQPVPLSKSPLAAITIDGDENWAEVVKWVFYVLFIAEEEEYTMVSPPLDDWGPTVPGLNYYAENQQNPNWPSDVIAEVGNYGEIYERTFGKDEYGDAFKFKSYIALPGSGGGNPIGLEIINRGLNELWTNGGLIYAPPIVRDNP